MVALYRQNSQKLINRVVNSIRYSLWLFCILQNTTYYLDLDYSVPAEKLGDEAYSLLAVISSRILPLPS